MDLFSLLPPNTVTKHKGLFINPGTKVLSKRCCILYLELNHEDSQITQIIAESAKLQPTNQVTKNVNGERITNKKAPNPLNQKLQCANVKKYLLQMLYPFIPLHLSIQRFQLIKSPLVKKYIDDLRWTQYLRYMTHRNVSFCCWHLSKNNMVWQSYSLYSALQVQAPVCGCNP